MKKKPLQVTDGSQKIKILIALVYGTIIIILLGIIAIK